MNKLYIIIILISASCSGQISKTNHCDILPLIIKKPIADITKLNLKGNVKSIETTDSHINKDKSYSYLQFDTNGFLTQQIQDEPYTKDQEGISYNNKITLRNKGRISNYSYIFKNEQVHRHIEIDSIFSINTSQKLIIKSIDKTMHTYNYDAKKRLTNYSYNTHSTDTMAVNSDTPILEVNIIYEKGKIKKAVETYWGDSQVWRYEYNQNNMVLKSDENTITYLDCIIHKETFGDQYSNTLRTYNSNGNRVSEKITYKDGEISSSHTEYDQMNNVTQEQRFTGSTISYTYEFDKHNNWTNKKMILTKTGEVIVESNRTFNYY